MRNQTTDRLNQPAAAPLLRPASSLCPSVPSSVVLCSGAHLSPTSIRADIAPCAWCGTISLVLMEEQSRGMSFALHSSFFQQHPRSPNLTSTRCARKSVVTVPSQRMLTGIYPGQCLFDFTSGRRTTTRVMLSSCEFHNISSFEPFGAFPIDASFAHQFGLMYIAHNFVVHVHYSDD